MNMHIIYYHNQGRKVKCMFIFSTKLTRGKLLTLALICSCLAVILLVSLPKGDVQTSLQSLKGKTNEQRVAYLQSFGWEVNTEPTQTVSVVIPSSFDETYESYNLLQKSQGFDLTSYQGKKATRYTYTVLNYPTAQTSTVSINLLVCDNKIIGGDVSSAALGGFMHSLTRPADGKQTIQQGGDANPAETPTQTPTQGATDNTAGRTADEILSDIRGTQK